MHVARELVVSIRNSIAQGSGGSFYFVSAVIFDEGQIATRALDRRTGRLPRADHLKRERERWMRGRRVGGKGETRCGTREASIWTITHTSVSLMRPLLRNRLASFFVRRPFSITYFHFPLLFPLLLLPHLLSECSNRVLSINIPLNYSVARRDAVTFSISSRGATRIVNIVVRPEI